MQMLLPKMWLWNETDRITAGFWFNKFALLDFFLEIVNLFASFALHLFRCVIGGPYVVKQRIIYYKQRTISSCDTVFFLHLYPRMNALCKWRNMVGCLSDKKNGIAYILNPTVIFIVGQ